jgi:phosphoribosylformylglycinamidine cyclo-ligase
VAGSGTIYVRTPGCASPRCTPGSAVQEPSGALVRPALSSVRRLVALAAVIPGRVRLCCSDQPASVPGSRIGRYSEVVTQDSSTSYRNAGVDTAAGDLAVELMKSAVSRTHGPEVVGGVGGFAGLFDVSALKSFTRPLLATSTDGVGTKVAIAQALDKHDTIGLDLVGMVVDDIVVVGAKPLFMTDYIACGRVVPQRIADIVAGIARGCAETGTALVGGETAEHPGLLGPDDYDVAGAAVGAVEADALLGAHRAVDGDVVLALESSGLHSNGYSLVRHILGKRGVGYSDRSDDLGGVVGEVLLEPTRLYTSPLLRLLASGADVHALSHVTGGGIAANLARVLPVGSWVELDRSTWSPQPVFRVLAEWGGIPLTDTEGTWNLGIGMIAVVGADAAAGVIDKLGVDGIRSWQLGTVSTSARDLTGFEQGAKGVDGGAVRLVGSYA